MFHYSKIKNAWEIIYNCPFILLVLFTSLFAVPCFNRIENRENDKEIAVIKVAKEESELLNEKPYGLDVFKKMFGHNLDSVDLEVGDDGNELRSDNENGENEGARKEENSMIENKKERDKDNGLKKTLVKPRQEEIRATEFVEYTPIETNSRYYSDAGKVALTTTYDYVLENDSYFNDAVFLGDSRTLGISDYAGLEGADFFCDNGMTIYKLLEDAGVTFQRTGEKMDMKKVLQEKHYGKIYIMLGMNELGYGDTPMYLKQYLKVLRQLREWQPDAIIYVMANLHVSREKNNMESEFNNININDKNVAAARLANGRDIFYLDCNPLFTDEDGFLQADLTFDGVHLYAQHYDKWRAFLMEHGVEKAESEAGGDDVWQKETAESEDGGGKEDAAKSESDGSSEDAAEHVVSPEEG